MNDVTLANAPAIPRQERDYYADLGLANRVDDIEFINKQ